MREKLKKIEKMVDASSCSGKTEVVITLDELRRAYNFGYNNAVDDSVDESAPVLVSVWRYEIE